MTHGPNMIMSAATKISMRTLEHATRHTHNRSTALAAGTSCPAPLPCHEPHVSTEMNIRRGQDARIHKMRTQDAHPRCSPQMRILDTHSRIKKHTTHASMCAHTQTHTHTSHHTHTSSHTRTLTRQDLEHAGCTQAALQHRHMCTCT